MLAFYSIIGFLIFVLSITVIHEGGHYLAAKWCKVKVLVFSIGMGPTLYSKVGRCGTRWCLKLWPIGGYVQLAGMGPEANVIDSAAEEHQLFSRQSIAKRALIVLAGPAANYIFSIILLTGILWAKGLTQLSNTVQQVIPESPAAIAGLQADDKILKFNTVDINSFQDIQKYLSLNLDKKIAVEIERQGRIVALELTPIIKSTAKGRHRAGFIGITAQPVLHHAALSIPKAFVLATHSALDYSKMSIEFIGQLLTGRRSLQEANSFIGIADHLGKTLELDRVGFLLLLAIISINIGFINLLPIPPLDGGQLVFLLSEAFGYKMSDRVRNALTNLGILLMIYVGIQATVGDIYRIFN